MKEGIDRRTLLKQAIAGAAAGEMLVRARDAKADIPPDTNWYDGIEMLFKRTAEKGLEHGDLFMRFEKGGTAWSDHAHDRSLLGLGTRDYDWKQIKERVAIDGPMSLLVDVHSHGSRNAVPKRTTGSNKNVSHTETQRVRHLSVPSRADLRSLFGKQWLMERNIESNSAPAQELRTENMRFTCLVLVEERKQGWYYEAFPPSEIRKRFPNVRTENLTTDAGNPEFIRREQALSAAIDAFQEASGRFEADLQRMRSDPAGEKYYQALMKAYANVGVLLRHVTWEELQKEPPGAGVLYKKQ